MIEHNPNTILFKQQMRDSLAHETKNSSAINIAKNNNVYTVGEKVRWSTSSKAGRLSLLWSRLEAKNACSLFTIQEMYSANYAWRG